MGYADRDKYGMYRNSSSGDAGPGPSLMGADTLIGDGVVNAAEEDLGDIKEIMIDMQTGQVAYAVLAFGGFLGVGEKLFAVPWQALHLDTVNKRFVLNVDKDRLKSAPGFDKDAWPDMGDMSWASGIHGFYGTDAGRPGGPTMGPGMPTAGMAGAGTGTGTGSATHTGGSSGSSMGAGAAGSAGSNSGSNMGSGGQGSSMGTGGAGASVDPRPGNLGDDTDISRIRGSNIG